MNDDDDANEKRPVTLSNSNEDKEELEEEEEEDDEEIEANDDDDGKPMTLTISMEQMAPYFEMPLQRAACRNECFCIHVESQCSSARTRRLAVSSRMREKRVF
jgi:fatty acid-binding protein DegV